ncbi:MFS general substrate transporter, partial [Martensiomyces pterosporus]
SPPPPDSAYSWLVVLGSFFSLMLSIGVTTTFGVYLQEYKLHEFPTASSSLLSWIGTFQFSLMCFFGIGVGILCEHVDTRILNAFGALVTGLSLIIASFCNSPWKLLLTQGLLFGFGGSFLYITGLVLPPQWFEKQRALATSIAIAGSGIGGLWLSFASRAMTDKLGRHWALRITGLIIIGVCGATSLLMKMRFKPVRREKIIDFSVLRDMRFVFLFFSALFGGSGYYIPYFFMPTYSAVVLGKSRAWGTNMSSILNAASIAGRVLMGLLGDRIGSLNTLWISTTVSCLSILVLWLPFKSTGTLLASGIIFGFCSGAIVSLIPVITANLFGVKRLPSIIGLMMVAYMAGGLIASPPAGAMLDTIGHGHNFNSLIIYDGVFLAVSAACQSVLRLILSRTLWKKV